MKATFLIMPTAIILAASIAIHGICPNRIYLSGIFVSVISSIFTLLFLSFRRKDLQAFGKSGNSSLKTYNFFFGYYFGISILGILATAFFLSCSNYHLFDQIF